MFFECERDYGDLLVRYGNRARARAQTRSKGKTITTATRADERTLHCSLIQTLEGLNLKPFVELIYFF